MRVFLRFSVVALLLATRAATLLSQTVTLPNRPDSLKVAIIGDNGTGKTPQYEVGEVMAKARQVFPFELVLMLGDNLYGGQSPTDFVDKFELPYKPLLDAGVTFHATLGNHDDRKQIDYAPFNLGPTGYHTFVRQHVRFVSLDSTGIDAAQLRWLERVLAETREDWLVCYFHYPLYSNAGRHGSDVELRVILEPLFVKYGVNVAFSGHDHIYERIRPQQGITYFLAGSGGQLRKGDLRPSPLTAAGFDQDQAFMLLEFAADELYFQTVSRTGPTVDAGVIYREVAARAGQLRSGEGP